MAASRTKAARSDAPKIRVTLLRSTIGHNAATRGTVRALGLRRLNQTVDVADTPENRGMLRRAAFLLEIEEPGGAAGASAKEGESA